MKKKISGWVKEFTGSAKGPEAPVWQPAGELYPRLIDSDAAAMGLVVVSGMAIIWYLGVRPQWLRVIASRDLAASLAAAKVAPAILGFQPKGGLFGAWAREPLPRATGLASHLVAVVRPMFVGPLLPGEVAVLRDTPPIDCPLPPGSEQAAVKRRQSYIFLSLSQS